MKKLLTMMILALAITIGIQFTDKSSAFAERIYCGTRGETDYYINTDNITVKENGSGKYTIICVFDVVFYGSAISNAGVATYDNSFGYWTCDGDPMDRWSLISKKGFDIVYPRIGNILDRQRRKVAEEEERKQRAQQEKENKFNALVAEGDKYYTAKDYENAKKAYQAARQINNGKVDEYCNNLIKNGDDLFNQQNYDAATDYYKKADVMGSSTASGKISNISKVKMELQKKAEMKAIIENQNEFISLYNQGNELYDDKKYPEAIKKYDEALNFKDVGDEENFKSVRKKIRRNMARSYYLMKDYDKAEKYISKNEYENYDVLGDIHFAKEDFEGAIYAYQKYLDNNSKISSEHKNYIQNQIKLAEKKLNLNKNSIRPVSALEVSDSISSIDVG